jgi:hypothetical protein
MEATFQNTPVFLVIGTVDGALLVLYCPIDDLEGCEIDHWFADLIAEARGRLPSRYRNIVSPHRI